MERVEWIRGELVIVMELADKNLMNVFLECRNKRAAGIPRDELLRYLHEAADVLDLINLRHGLQHLDIKPGNLFLVSNHVKVGDFGLVRSLTEARSAGSGRQTESKGDLPPSSRNPPAGRMAVGLTARYAAPEIFRNTITSSCDQYSLAIVYQELLTGKRPFQGRNARQLMMQHCTATPDLNALPEIDRAVVARALFKDPDQRFPTCTAFVQALKASGKLQHDAASSMETIRCIPEWIEEKSQRREQQSGQSPRSDPGPSLERRTGMSRLVAELIIEAKAAQPAREPDGLKAAAQGATVLQGQFPARLWPPTARAGFETFRRQWNAEVVHEEENSLVFQIPFPGCFWKRWLEGTRGLLVEVRWALPGPVSAMCPELTVRIRCSDKKNRAEQRLLSDVGPLILDSLRSHVEAYPERRTQERVAWPHSLRATFLLAENTSKETIEGKGKDLSLGGMGLYLPRAFAGSQVQLELLRPSRSESIVLYGNCVRVQLCSDGWFEAGVLF